MCIRDRVNQENLDKLDERIELLKEELNKEISDNYESTNQRLEAVSYTHLDVYKRQIQGKQKTM